jgi:hypothetical protein
MIKKFIQLWLFGVFVECLQPTSEISKRRAEGSAQGRKEFLKYAKTDKILKFGRQPTIS